MSFYEHVFLLLSPFNFILLKSSHLNFVFLVNRRSQCLFRGRMLLRSMESRCEGGTSHLIKTQHSSFFRCDSSW